MTSLRALCAIALTVFLAACATAPTSETTAQSGPDKANCGQEARTGSNLAAPRCRATP